MPVAFVIMPFSADFSGIYERFIKETLLESGFKVTRADDIENSRNILSDIVNMISEADLIIADLTGSNPNVYYELGIAHAFKKSVIMLSQDIGEVPFDLRSYRIILYTTDFIKIQEAREQLGKLLRDSLTGSTQFGNPVTDFLKSSPIQSKVLPISSSNTQRGIVDLNADFEESVVEINECLSAVSEQFVAIGQHAELATKESANKSATERRALLRDLAGRLSDFSKSINKQNRTYQSAVTKFESSISDLLEVPFVATSEDYRIALSGFVDLISGSKHIGEDSLKAIREFQSSLAGMPNLELHFNIANDSASSEMKSLIQTIEKHLSVFSRAEILSRNLLERNVEPVTDETPGN